MIVWILFVILLTPFSVYGHKPLDTSGVATRDRPIIVEDHWVSWAAYNELENRGDIHYYQLVHVKKGEKIYLDLLIPKIQRLKSFHPVFALIGPGISDDWSGLDETSIVLDIEGGQGVLVKPYTGEVIDSFYEPFTQTEYWKKQKLEYYAKEDGDFFVVVFDVEGNRGKYVLSIGSTEQWSFKDLLQMPRIWWDVRMFMEKEQATYRAIGIAAFCISLFGIYRIAR